MEKGKLGVMVETKFQQNPVQVVQARLKDLVIGFESWLAKQSLPVEGAVVALTSSTQGAVIGAIMGNITNNISSTIPTPPPPANLCPQAMASLQQAQALGGGPLIQARNFAVMTGVNASLSYVMERVRGKEDVQSSMVATFGFGALFSSVSGMNRANHATNATISLLVFSLH
ncbi:hypothetical protein LWI28_014172 [Acer negundo]|uniref:Uncharacterized protein n=1 Tax=Acer negundo TaxID=4023 RepID=A0AAD5I6R5_ACENE|nr:hypothetical protein LWI28_014172 [Acer negundo]